MKVVVCYLIMCHNNPKQVKRIIEALQAEDAHFVVHIDKKSKYDFSGIVNLQNTYVLPNRISVVWGAISMIDAIISLSEYALRRIQEVSHYCLISGADFPVKSHIYIKEYLSEHKGIDFITGIPLPSPDTKWIEGGRRRIYCYNVYCNSHSSATIEPRKFSYQNLRQIVKIAVTNFRQLKLGLKILLTYKKRELPNDMKMYGKEVWWILTKETLENVLNWNRQHPEYREYHKYTQITDEIYINTIVWNIADNPCNDMKRYVSWEKQTDPSPRWLEFPKDNKLVLNCISNPDYFFVRKVQDEKLIDFIEEHIGR
ncbi:MAG TPA: hypothetical protein DDY68_03080 [Porphyromonadaceae bacterium]|nr:hypothetical protein [Porphyromonadaceae bacterium]